MFPSELRLPSMSEIQISSGTSFIGVPDDNTHSGILSGLCLKNIDFFEVINVLSLVLSISSDSRLSKAIITDAKFLLGDLTIQVESFKQMTVLETNYYILLKRVPLAPKGIFKSDSKTPKVNVTIILSDRCNTDQIKYITDAILGRLPKIDNSYMLKNEAFV